MRLQRGLGRARGNLSDDPTKYGKRMGFLALLQSSVYNGNMEWVNLLGDEDTVRYEFG